MSEKVVELPELTLKLNHSEKERLYTVLTVRAVRLLQEIEEMPVENIGDHLANRAREIALELAHTSPVRIDPLILAVHLGLLLGSMLEAANGGAAATPQKQGIIL